MFRSYLAHMCAVAFVAHMPKPYKFFNKAGYYSKGELTNISTIKFLATLSFNKRFVF